MEGYRDLVQIGQADCGASLLASLIQRGQEHRGENANDGNDHQQFDERKSPCPTASGTKFSIGMALLHGIVFPSIYHGVIRHRIEAVACYYTVI